MDYFGQVSAAADAVRARVGDFPSTAIVLGSGLGDFASSLGTPTSIPYTDLPNWPVSRIAGHDGRLVVGTSKGRRVVALAGRSHLYEGHPPQTVTFSVRVLGLLGVKHLILTNAAGGVNTGFSAGALMVIDDHINLMGQNPLAGANDDRFGARFPDMSDVYSARLRGVADATSRGIGVPVTHGVYAALLGPSYETPAEIRYLRKIGADAVGMSTVPEVIVARALGMRVAGISCITNAAAGVTGAALSHAEVLETTNRVSGAFESLVTEFLSRLGTPQLLAIK